MVCALVRWVVNVLFKVVIDDVVGEDPTTIIT